MTRKDALEKIACRLRIHSLKTTTAAGSGHPTTCLSSADLMACLLFDVMRYNPRKPGAAGNDELVLSKGHAAPLLWAAYAEAGVLSIRRLNDLRKVTSELEGHPTPRMPWIKAATGSLGQGLSVGVGLALAQKISKSPAGTYVLMGDGECAEGAVWEAAASASHLGLRNLCAVVDVNGLGQSDPTMHGHDAAALARKFRAFGWETLTIDGHKIEKIQAAFEQAGRVKKPVALLAKTFKGKGVSFIENKNGWHGKPLNAGELEKALDEIGPMPDIDSRKYVRKPRAFKPSRLKKTTVFPRTPYKDKTATRRAYGNALAALGGVNDAVLCIDGDVKNSTYADKFFSVFPKRSFQSFIAEQNMIGMGMGLAAGGYNPFLATFAAFLTRAHDQIRMAAYSFSDIKLCGSHVGVSIGEDGPSQMGLEDLAIFRSIPGCLVLYPSDAFSAEACVETMAAHKGMAYIRTTRPATPLLYGPEETFPAGGSKTLRSSASDAAAVIAGGITVHEALKACDELAAEGIAVRVIDAYSVQPLDVEGIRRAAAAAGGRAVVVEDHYPGGGLGEAVAAALAGSAALKHLCIRELPRSGKPHELMDLYGIGARHIAAAVRELGASSSRTG